MKTFLVSYRHEGARWVVELPARDFDDAKARVKQMAFAKVDGEVIAKVPAVAGPLVGIASAIRNCLSRLVAPRGI